MWCPRRRFASLWPCLVGVWVRGRVASCCCSACFAARCYCITAGWGETEVLMDVSSRRLAIVQHRHLPARGLLSLFSLLRAFSLTVIKRNQGETITGDGTFSVLHHHLPGQPTRTEFRSFDRRYLAECQSRFNSPAQSWPASFCRARRSSWRPGTGASTFDRP